MIAYVRRWWLMKRNIFFWKYIILQIYYIIKRKRKLIFTLRSDNLTLYVYIYIYSFYRNVYNIYYIYFFIFNIYFFLSFFFNLRKKYYICFTVKVQRDIEQLWFFARSSVHNFLYIRSMSIRYENHCLGKQ